MSENGGGGVLLWSISPQYYRLAGLAFIEELAGSSRHDLPLCVAALWTCQHRFENYFRHTFNLGQPI
jgi:hypothetical protein